MERKIRITIGIAALLAIFGCATTKIDSFKDPQANGKTYKNILVFGSFSDLGAKKSAEEAFSRVFLAQGVNAVPSITVFLPTRTYKEEEIAKILKEGGFDSVLSISLKKAYNDRVYVPGQSNTDCKTYSYGRTHCDTSRSPGYYVTKPRIKCELKLMDVETDTTAWVASSFTRGNSYADINVMSESLAREALDKLAKEGLVTLTPKPQK